MSEALDLDALVVEQTGEPFTFTFGGETYTVAPVLDLRIPGALRVGDWARAIEILVGAEQWDRIVASSAVLQLQQAEAMINGFTAHLGTSPGKSRASSRSSKRTGTPSKRTSSSTSRRGSRT